MIHTVHLTYSFLPMSSFQLSRESVTSLCWNSHRIRRQEKLEIPTGVPEHMFSFAGQYGGTNMEIKLSKDQLTEVSELSGVMDGHLLDFIDTEVKRECVNRYTSKSGKSRIKECH